jgi:hypothetical protein
VVGYFARTLNEHQRTPAAPVPSSLPVFHVIAGGVVNGYFASGARGRWFESSSAPIMGPVAQLVRARNAVCACSPVMAP